MLGILSRLPFFLSIMGLAFLSMLVPAGYALAIEEFHDARSFFYGTVLGLTLTALMGLALGNRDHNRSALRLLLQLAASFLILPALMAIPFHEAVRNTTYVSAYFEMVSSMTTTGATIFDAARLSGPEHLWRAQVGWMGGLLMWIAASAILAPLALGGFEVTASGEPGQTILDGSARSGTGTPGQRVWRATEVLVPIYAGLTLGLAVMLLVAGDPPLVALSHAMAVLSTSGITPLASLGAAPSGLAGEMILFCFLFFALSRLTFSSDTRNGQSLWYDPEFRMGILLVAAVPAALFVRHWAGAFDVGQEQDWVTGVRALWGALFTAMSFLSTTGFLSGDWDTARAWSGLPTPGIILMGLAVIGGGVATTAGGVKLLRVYTLYANGLREMERLIHPSSVGRAGLMGRRTRREGAFIAWVVFMLFAIMIAALTLIFGSYGLTFEEATVVAVVALSNTGPLAQYAAAEPINMSAWLWDTKLIMCLAMVLGRLELLAFIVMLTPESWRE
ncbi:MULTISPECIES: TrkH family potassium uptake protein [Ponticoccus]|uniref:Potassium transporter TrkG n=1 Tax=Ponticoccus litoralis TaxID=422297 RepID=A0AAW9STI9_9RHOB